MNAPITEQMEEAQKVLTEPTTEQAPPLAPEAEQPQEIEKAFIQKASDFAATEVQE